MIHALPSAARARTAALPMVGPDQTLVPLRQLLRPVLQALFHPYRPELHYMRGPGPKWHEKHGPRHRDRRD